MSASTEPDRLDAESRTWIARLRPGSRDRDAAIAALHALLLDAARFEVRRRSATFPHLRGGDHDDLAHQSADDALMAVLRKLDGFRGDSRFTTWVYKFALLEAGVKVRRRAWQGREIPLDTDGWVGFVDPAPSVERDVESGELLAVLQDAIRSDLTPHQRRVLLAVTIEGVPIDVLAERLDSTRGALYKTIHDARRKLRAVLEARGLGLDGDLEVPRT